MNRSPRSPRLLLPHTRRIVEFCLVAIAFGFQLGLPAQSTHYERVEVFDAARHDGVPIEFVGEVTEASATRDGTHLRVFAQGAREKMLIFIPSSTLDARPDLWNLQVGAMYVFRGEGELYRGVEKEIIVRENDPSPDLVGGGGAPPPAPGVGFGAQPGFGSASTFQYDPVMRAASDDAEAQDIERRYEAIANQQIVSHAAEVTTTWQIMLPSGRTTGSASLVQQWSKPDQWHVLGTHEGAIPASALSVSQENAPVTGRSLVVVGSEGCFALYDSTNPASGEQTTFQFATPRNRWDEMVNVDRGHEAGWLFMATGALPIHNPFGLFEAGTVRMDGTGLENGQTVVYLTGRGRFLRDFPPSAPERPTLRVGLLRDSLQLSSMQARGAGFEVRSQVTRFTANYNPDPSLFRAPSTPDPYVAWGMLGRSPLIAGGRRLNLNPYAERGMQLVFYPGFTVLVE